MYHVTKEVKEPKWSKIEARCIANDKRYDGDLLGLPLASFTTTLNEYICMAKNVCLRHHLIPDVLKQMRSTTV